MEVFDIDVVRSQDRRWIQRNDRVHRKDGIYTKKDLKSEILKKAEGALQAERHQQRNIEAHL